MAWTKDREFIGIKAIWWASVIAAGVLYYVTENRHDVGIGMALGVIGGALGFALEEQR